MARSEASRLLACYVNAGTSRKELARRLGVHVSDLSRWISGTTQPNSIRALDALVRVGIPLHAWLTAPSFVQQCTAENVIIDSSAAE